LYTLKLFMDVVDGGTSVHFMFEVTKKGRENTIQREVISKSFSQVWSLIFNCSIVNLEKDEMNIETLKSNF